jgi:hypothetical protein
MPRGLALSISPRDAAQIAKQVLYLRRDRLQSLVRHLLKPAM